MHCIKCGTQLPQDAKFCYKCGTSVGGTGNSVEEEKWEYCEIGNVNKENYFLFFLDTGKVHLFVKSVSPVKGRYTVLESRHIRWWSDGDYYKKIRLLLDEVTLQLVGDGWEPLPGHGTYWWELRFKRKIK